MLNIWPFFLGILFLVGLSIEIRMKDFILGLFCLGLYFVAFLPSKSMANPFPREFKTSRCIVKNFVNIL